MRLGLLTALLLGSTAVAGDWIEWGGEGRDFTVREGKISAWSEDGPTERWRRPLGDGYSSILADGDTLYTMYRSGDATESVIAIDAETGKTIWEFEHPAPLWDGFNARFGPGPHATPIIHENRIYMVGVRGDVLCLRKSTGKRLWLRRTWEDFGSRPPDRGYSSSPMIYGGNLIVPVGGRGRALVAFDLHSGEVAWKAGSYENAFSSPLLINVDGQDQIVLFAQGHVAGFEASNGEELWSHPHRTKYEVNAATPVWGDDNLLFMSSAYDKGGQVIQLAREGGKTSVKPVWFERKFQVHHGSVVRIGDTLHGSHGDFGPAFLTSADVKTGKLLSRQRGFGKANLLAVGDRILLLDDDGTLALARPVADSLQIESEAQIFDSRTWTAPTLVGSRLYLRDRNEIVALELP